MKRYIYFTLVCAVALLAAACGNRKKAEAGEAAAQAEVDSIAAVKSTEDSLKMEKTISELPEEPVLDIITNLGTMTVKLYSGTPKHRDNFVKLAQSGFYNGVLFHRVINGVMIQAGDPLSKDEAQKAVWGTGGPGYTVPAEILPQKYNHKKGALAAARRGDAANPYRESSGSQFYIVQDERNCAQLDGAYTVFGEVTEGLPVIDKIASVQTDGRDRPLSPVKIVTIKVHE